MNCERARSLIDAYSTDELDLAAALDVEEHLRQCPACATDLDPHIRGRHLELSGHLIGKVGHHQLVDGPPCVQIMNAGLQCDKRVGQRIDLRKGAGVQRRLVHRNRRLANRPFETGEVSNVWQLWDAFSKEVRKITAVFRNTGDSWRTVSNEL